MAWGSTSSATCRTSSTRRRSPRCATCVASSTPTGARIPGRSSRCARAASGTRRRRDVARCTGMAESRDLGVVEQVRDAATTGEGLRIVGAGTWLDAGHPVRASRTLSLADDRGVVAYSPGDLTITVRAGTTLAEIADALRAH